MNKVVRTFGSLFLITVGASIAAKGGKYLIDTLSEAATENVPKIIVIHKEVIKDVAEKASEVASDVIDEVKA